MHANIDAVMKLGDVERVTGRKKSAIYADPSFPRPIRLGSRSVGWLSSEVAAWIADRKAERDTDLHDAA